MIDTVRLQWADAQLGEGFGEWLEANYPMARRTSAAYSWDRPWEGTMFTDGVLGTVGTKSSSLGQFLWVEKSIPKLVFGEDNCRQLTLSEAREGVAMLAEAVVGHLGAFLPISSCETAQCKRVDFYHQRPMPAAEVFSHIARCLKRQKGVALHLTGVEVHQSREIHARFYDKGVEAGNEQFVGVIRHEEQLRGSRAKALVDMKGLKLDPAAIRAQMNRRFDGWPAEVECYGYDELLEEHSYRGAVAALLCEVPQLEGSLKRHLSKDLFYKCKNLAIQAQRRMFKLDLRVPDDAWAQPMVL